MSSISLLLYNGTKVPLTIDENVFAKINYKNSAEQFTVNDLVDYLFTYWGDIFQDKDIESPINISQIQLLHLGSRLQPETQISSLKLSVSPILHLVIKPADMAQQSVDNNATTKKGLLKRFISGTSVGNTKGTNSEPVYRKRSIDNTGSSMVNGSNTSMKMATTDNSQRERRDTLGSNGVAQGEGDTLSSADEPTDARVSENIALTDTLNQSDGRVRPYSVEDSTRPNRSNDNGIDASTGCCVIF